MRDQGLGIAFAPRMARGWESKSVEAQQEEALRTRVRAAKPTAEQLAQQEKRRALELTRKRAVDDLGRASAPAHRTMLERAIADLDKQIAALTSPDELKA
jgi:hypothetical protein